MEVLLDIFGERGFIDMGVSSHAMVNDVIIQHRRMRHRVQRYIEVEDIIDSMRSRVDGGG